MSAGPEEKFEYYGLDYEHGGKSWGINILATSEEDAMARAKAMGRGRVLGKLMATVPLGNPLSSTTFLVFLVVAFAAFAAGAFVYQRFAAGVAALNGG